MPFTNKKIIVSGKSIHVYEYTRPIQYGISGVKRRRKKRYSFRTAEKNKSNAYRAVKNFRLLLSANAEQAFTQPSNDERIVFVTLTFKENITDITEANKLFTKFIKTFNQALEIKLKYIVVPEIQKKREKQTGFSVWHYHAIIFNFPKVENSQSLLLDFWPHGFTFNNTVKTYRHLQNYLSKYFLKTFETSELYNKKKYFRSRNLISPRVYRDEEDNNTIISLINDPPAYSKQYIDLFGHPIKYTLYTGHPLSNIL